MGMADKGMVAIIKQGAWTNGLFDIKCPDCFKDCVCFACLTSAAINTKLGNPCAPAVSYLGAFFGCTCCLLIKYGQTFKGPLEPMPVGVFKAWCCGGCYAHQQSKEPFSSAAAAVGNMVGQQEMS